MESSQPVTSTSNSPSSLDDDSRRALIRQRYAQLHAQMERLQCQHKVARLSNVFQYIENTYFYESLAQIGLSTRLNHFYRSLHVGDRFVAKVTSLFERSADVLLIWSPKRDIFDLKIKAFLRLVEMKRYSNHRHSSNKYNNRQNSVAQCSRNLDASELIFVEVIHCSASRKIEVARCKSLSAIDDELVEDNHHEESDAELLNEDKYRAKSSDVVFHEYMLRHRDLRNPSIIKQPIFTSMLNHNLVIESYKRKLEDKGKKANVNLDQKDDDKDVIILDDSNTQRAAPLNGSNRIQSGDTLGQTNRSSCNQSESLKGVDHSASTDSQSRKRTHSVVSDRGLSSQRHLSSRRSRSQSRSASSPFSSNSDSSSSSSSSDDSRKRRRHSKKHKKRSKKHSKKSKKKKSKKDHRRRRRRKSDSSDQRSHSPNRKRTLDNKILKLLNMTQ